MKRILYLSLLIMIPAFLSANSISKQPNNTWISSDGFDVISVNFKNKHLKVKGLNTRRWNRFYAINRYTYRDNRGNIIRVKNPNTLIYKGIQTRRNIVFHRSRSRNNRFFNKNRSRQYTFDNYDDRYLDNRLDNYSTGRVDDRLSGRYFAREIDQYVTIELTVDGLRARRANSDWKYYKQNRNRPNEYRGDHGATYLIRNDGSIRYTSKNGELIINLSKR